MKFSEKLGAWQHVRGLRTRVGLQIGVHNTRAHRDRAEAHRLLLGGQDAGQHVDASLGRAVHGLARQRGQRSGREDVDDPPGHLRIGEDTAEQVGQHRSRGQIHRQRAHDLARRQPPQHANRAHGCRVVQQARRRGPCFLQALQHRRQRGGNARGVGQIETRELIALSRERRVARPANADHRESALKQLGGEGRAKAAGDARDDGRMLAGTTRKTHCRDVSGRRTQRRRNPHQPPIAVRRDPVGGQDEVEGDVRQPLGLGLALRRRVDLCEPRGGRKLQVCASRRLIEDDAPDRRGDRVLEPGGQAGTVDTRGRLVGDQGRAGPAAADQLVTALGGDQQAEVGNVIQAEPEQARYQRVKLGCLLHSRPDLGDGGGIRRRVDKHPTASADYRGPVTGHVPDVSHGRSEAGRPGAASRDCARTSPNAGSVTPAGALGHVVHR